jgi:hypothetical protein
MFDIKTTKCQQRKKILDLTFSKEETLYFGQSMRLQQHFQLIHLFHNRIGLFDVVIGENATCTFVFL